jgi:O-antigen ligase
MEVPATAEAEWGEGKLSAWFRIWIGCCLLYPLVTMCSIAAANLLLGLIVAGCLVFRKHMFFDKSRTLFVLLGIYLVWNLAAVAFSPYPGPWSMWFEKRSTMLAIFPGLVVGAEVSRLRTAYRYVAVLLVVEAIYAVFQYFYGWDLVRSRSLKDFGGHYLATGLQNFHLTFAGMIALALPASLGVVPKKFVDSTLLVLAGTLCIVTSMSRSMMLGMIGGGILFIALGSKRLKLAGAILICALIVLSSTIFNASGHRMSIGLGMSDTQEVQGDPTRIYLWKSALNIIQHYPLLGVGVNGWDGAFEKYKVPYDNYSSTAHAHNDYLASTVEGGLIGGTLFLLLWAYIVLKGTQAVLATRGEARDQRLGFLVALLVLLFGGLFQCYQHDAENALLLWFTVGVGIQLSVGKLRLRPKVIQRIA